MELEVTELPLGQRAGKVGGNQVVEIKTVHANHKLYLLRNRCGEFVTGTLKGLFLAGLICLGRSGLADGRNRFHSRGR